MNAQEAIMTRRSTRRYQKRAVEEDVLDAVLQAGRAAPSGGNNQYTHLLVVRRPQVLSALNTLVKDTFAAMEVTGGMYASMAAAIRAARGENYLFHFGAPVLIIAANRADYGNNLADTACCLENMMIMANALDLGTCWVNQLRWLNEDAGIRAYLEGLGMDGQYRVYGALALGYADSETGLPERTPLPRKGNRVTMI